MLGVYELVMPHDVRLCSWRSAPTLARGLPVLDPRWLHSRAEHRANVESPPSKRRQLRMEEEEGQPNHASRATMPFARSRRVVVAPRDDAWHPLLRLMQQARLIQHG